MNSARYERFILIFLCALLLLGAVRLSGRFSRPYSRITIVENGVKQELTLKEVEDLLSKEKKVNINTALMDELVLIPGIGKVLAAQIIECRNASGRFYCVNDLLKVKGIGKKKLENLKEYVNFN